MDDVEGSRATEGRPWSPIAFRGRLGRGAFVVFAVAWHMVVGLGAGLVFLLVFAPWLSFGGAGADGAVLGLGALVLVVYVVGMASFVVRRLHDLGRSSAWALLGLVPVVNLALLVVLVVAPGLPVDAGTAASSALGTPSDSVVGSDRWGGVTATLRAAHEEAERSQEAAFEEGRRFAERSSRRTGEIDAG